MEKITIRRANFFDNKVGLNFYYVHSAVEKNIGKIISVMVDGIEESNNEDMGNKISMHIAALNHLAVDKDGIKKEIIDKELEIIKLKLQIQENQQKWLKKFQRENFKIYQ